MKLIGITGKPGSGKTTFSNQLETKDTVGVIHIDDLVGEVKKKYFKLLIRKKLGDDKRSNPPIKSNIKELFYKNKFIFTAWLKIRNILISKELEKRMTELKQEGKGIIVLDDWALSSNYKLMKKLDYIYGMKRTYLKRRKGLKERDNLNLYELRVAELPYTLEHLKLPDGENVSIITNDGSLEELRKIADREYERIGILSFNERYAVKAKESAIFGVAHSLGKARKVASQEKLYDED